MGLSITRQAVRIVALAAFALNVTGCSALFLEAPPDRSHWNKPGVEYRQCDTAGILPFIDFLIAGIGVANVVMLAREDDKAARPYAVAAGVEALIFTMSGIAGSRQTSKCEAFQAHQRKRVEAAGGGLPSVPISNAD